ncbi:carbonic anhydrase [Proteinivorax hydrogeniformans]|uniref:carbonic anhydrase n=1 Tax=Proteinivorax hydrogeniformans TaxID=1826727 RepID=A0AAU8HV77_9FIRM
MEFEEFLSNNKRYLEQYGEMCKCKMPKYPRKKMAILTCMDTRLTFQLEKSLGLKRGDAIILKTAGNNMQGQEVRSLIAAIYTLKVEKVMVIGHPDCGMANLDIENLKKTMLARGVKNEEIENLGDLEAWFETFCDSKDNVLETVEMLINHPLIPSDVKVAGFYFDQDTSQLSKLC